MPIPTRIVGTLHPPITTRPPNRREEPHVCQSANCCTPIICCCCAPTRGKSLLVTTAAALVAAFALVCAWAYVAVKVAALVLLRPVRLSLIDMPMVVTSWWSPTVRHLLAHQLAQGRLVLPAGPGAIQATMAALALTPAVLVVWIRCGRPIPAPLQVRCHVRARVRVELARLPATVRRPPLPGRAARAPAALPARHTPETGTAAPPASVAPRRYIRPSREDRS